MPFYDIKKGWRNLPIRSSTRGEPQWRRGNTINGKQLLTVETEEKYRGRVKRATLLNLVDLSTHRLLHGGRQVQLHPSLVDRIEYVPIAPDISRTNDVPFSGQYLPDVHGAILNTTGFHTGSHLPRTGATDCYGGLP